LLRIQAETRLGKAERREVTVRLKNTDVEGEDIFTRLHFTGFQEVWSYYILLIITSTIKTDVWEDKVKKCNLLSNTSIFLPRTEPTEIIIFIYR
jgi:hypothetical protein